MFCIFATVNRYHRLIIYTYPYFLDANIGRLFYIQGNISIHNDLNFIGSGAVHKYLKCSSHRELLFERSNSYSYGGLNHKSTTATIMV